MKLIKIEVDVLPSRCSHCDFSFIDEDHWLLCAFKRKACLDNINGFSPYRDRAPFCPLTVPTANPIEEKKPLPDAIGKPFPYTTNTEPPTIYVYEGEPLIGIFLRNPLSEPE